MQSLISEKLGKRIGASLGKTNTEKEYDKLKNKRTNSQLKFPSELLTPGYGHGHFTLFNINVPQGSKFVDRNQKIENEIESPYSSPVVDSTEAGSIRRHTAARQVRTNESIVLDMPNEISSNYGVQWNASELGIAGRAVQAYGNMSNISLGDVANAIKEESKRAVAGAVQAITPVNAEDAVELATGTISNPFVEVLFKGVNNRELNLRYVLSAKNREEMEEIRSIIRRLKYHQHPEYKYRENDSAYLLYPSTFDITFMYLDDSGSAQRNTWLFRMSTCGLTNIQTNYTPDGEYNVRFDNSPVSITLDLSFIELEQLHKGRFEDDEDSF